MELNGREKRPVGSGVTLPPGDTFQCPTTVLDLGDMQLQFSRSMFFRGEKGSPQGLPSTWTSPYITPGHPRGKEMPQLGRPCIGHSMSDDIHPGHPGCLYAHGQWVNPCLFIHCWAERRCCGPSRTSSQAGSPWEALSLQGLPAVP